MRPKLQFRAIACVALSLLLLAPTTLGAARKQSQAESKRSARHDIENLEEQWRRAQLAGDLPAMDRLLSEDFVGISMTGQANTKSQQLERFRSRRLALTRIELSDRKIKLLGLVAIVTSKAEVDGTNEGEPIKGSFRYTRIYQRLPSGTWVTTNFEATRIPANRP